jgi:hypothetical protein
MHRVEQTCGLMPRISGTRHYCHDISAGKEPGHRAWKLKISPRCTVWKLESSKSNPHGQREIGKRKPNAAGTSVPQLRLASKAQTRTSTRPGMTGFERKFRSPRSRLQESLEYANSVNDLRAAGFGTARIKPKNGAVSPITPTRGGPGCPASVGSRRIACIPD